MESDLRPALLIKGVPRPQVKWKVLEKKDQVMVKGGIVSVE